MKTKTSQALALFNAKRFREAFRIFKTFRGQFSPEETRTVEIAYECMTGHARFYEMLGIDAEDAVRNAIFTIKTKYAL